MTKRTIQNKLRKALLENADMPYSLYKHELEENLDFWKAGMRRDGDDFLFVVTENNGHVAMLLMTSADELFINEQAREKLRSIWNLEGVYESNITNMLPLMAEQLAAEIFWVTGVRIMPPPPHWAAQDSY